MPSRLIFSLLFSLALFVPEMLRADAPNLTFPDGDPVGCGDIFVAKVNSDNNAAVFVDGYPPRAGFGTVSDQGETKELDVSPSAWIQVGLEVRGPGDVAFNYCSQSSDYYDRSGGSVPATWVGTSGHASIRLYSDGGNEYADIKLTNIIFTSPDLQNTVTLPSLTLTHAHVGWYTPG